jgi:hypothetical protein
LAPSAQPCAQPRPHAKTCVRGCMLVWRLKQWPWPRLQHASQARSRAFVGGRGASFHFDLKFAGMEPGVHSIFVPQLAQCAQGLTFHRIACPQLCCNVHTQTVHCTCALQAFFPSLSPSFHTCKYELKPPSPEASKRPRLFLRCKQGAHGRWRRQACEAAGDRTSPGETREGAINHTHSIGGGER